MKIAVIDMGTNTFHLLLAEVEDEKFDVIYRDRKAVKIGEKGINEGKISPAAEERAIRTLKEFRKTIDEHGIDRIFATATSAIRNASNGALLVERVKQETGITVRVISGVEEAEYIYYGVDRAIDLKNDVSLIMDIGGGSIEFIITDENEPKWIKSFEIGGQRLVEKFHDSDPIGIESIERLEKYLDTELQDLFEAAAQYKPRTLVGCSGTFDTLSDIHRIEMGLEKELDATELPLDLKSFEKSYLELVSKNREERMAIPGMIELRVDMIVVAVILVNFIIARLELSDIRVSAYALKEGVLLSLLDEINHPIWTK